MFTEKSNLQKKEKEGFMYPEEDNHLNVPDAVREIQLPRIPTFQGALLFITCEQGSVMRDGIEIDTAEEIAVIPPETGIYAIERRMNSSNILRFKVIYEGKVGWISERMRGGSEEMMIEYLNVPDSELEEARISIEKEAESMNYDGQTKFDDVADLGTAMSKWVEQVERTIPGYKWTWTAAEEDLSYKRYLELATTIDGETPWSVEADMQVCLCLCLYFSTSLFLYFPISLFLYTVGILCNAECCIR